MKSTQDKNAIFVSVIESHKGILYKIANAYCKDSEDRKDLIQEIYIQLWESFDSYNDDYKYSTWIYRISLNVAISFYRKENSRSKISSPFNTEIFNIADTINIEKEEENINLGILQKFISELKELDKALILLYLEEKSYKEIADIIGFSETNVATKIGRIKLKLKEKFSQIINQ
ncbi:MAG TPA: sigma-70 family RNA polymerase sigma factor [Ignavibacteria bacterium]|nr:sigma-70 family RNA polymerase sigma factor [Ignavibacteria bacterium]